MGAVIIPAVWPMVRFLGNLLYIVFLAAFLRARVTQRGGGRVVHTAQLARFVWTGCYGAMSMCFSHSHGLTPIAGVMDTTP